MTFEEAYRYSDNYTVQSPDGFNVWGCEHNKEEAEALVRYLSGEMGRVAVVVSNGPDKVRESKAIRPGEPYRAKFREEAFIATGIWATPTRRRRTSR